MLTPSEAEITSRILETHGRLTEAAERDEGGLPPRSLEIVRIPVESSGSGFHMLSSSGNAGNSFL